MAQARIVRLAHRAWSATRKPGNDGTAREVSRLPGLLKTGAARRVVRKRNQVTMRVMVCDQGPNLLSLPIILQRKEYSFPDWKPDMTIWVQSPKLAL